jgi:hypothetical protein
MNTVQRKMPWHMRLVIGYLLIAGAWTWAGMWWAILVKQIPIAANANVYGVGLVIALACFGAAYAMYRRNKLVIACIAIVPVAQWVGFAILSPHRVAATDFVVDINYLRQLPPLFVADIAFYIVLTLYAAMLWKRRALA